mgnify:FL=1
MVESTIEKIVCEEKVLLTHVEEGCVIRVVKDDVCVKMFIKWGDELPQSVSVVAIPKCGAVIKKAVKSD